MPEIKLEAITPWAPHPTAAPQTGRNAETLTVAANGTRTCCGGWQLHYTGITPGQTYAVSTEVSCEDVENLRDALYCVVRWADLAPDETGRYSQWGYLLPERVGENRVRFTGRFTAPEGAEHLTVRCTLRWAAAGRSPWSLPQVVADATPVTARRPVTISVVTGHVHSRRGPFKTVQDNVEFYARLCEAACRDNPDLIVLPEIALQWGVPGHSLDTAVPAPGPETAAFAAIAARRRVRIALGMLERDGDAVFNSVVLISPEGVIDGTYHKVHLATGGEDISGILPGDGFPVFATEIGRIGCNICMDSSAAESSRMVGLNGADFLLLPIMGDHRADRWNTGIPVYSEERWKAIQRTRAMDNQLCFVAARNTAQGSCIIDRKGDILAWNEGDRDHITATVNLDDGYRTWDGGCFRQVNWLQRRPHLYGAFVDEENLGSL